MKLRVLAPLGVTLCALTLSPAPAGAQQLDALPTCARWFAAGGQAALAPHAVDAAFAKPRRWPFILAGGILGGAIAGAWYAHEAAASGDPMFDLSEPVVGIGVGVGALAGLILSEVVRDARARAPAT